MSRAYCSLDNDSDLNLFDFFFFLSSAKTSFMVFSNHELFQFLSFKGSYYLLLLYRQNACFCLLHLHSCTVLSEGLGAHHIRGTLGHKQLLPQLSLLLHESLKAQEGSSELEHSQSNINKIIKIIWPSVKLSS